MGNVLAFCEFPGGALRTSALVQPRVRPRGRHRRTAARSSIAARRPRRAGRRAPPPRSTRRRSSSSTTRKLEHYLAETYAPILARLAKANKARRSSRATATVDRQGPDAARRRAARRRHGVGHREARRAKNQFVRPILAGNAYSTVEITTPIICVTVRQSEFEPAAELGERRRGVDGAGRRRSTRSARSSSSSTRRRAIAPTSATPRSSSRAAAA